MRVRVAIAEAFDLLAKEIAVRRKKQIACNSTLGRRDHGEPDEITDAYVYEGALKHIAAKLRKIDAEDRVIESINNGMGER